MPMLDAYIPTGALEPQAERQLMGALTDALLRWEGADPSDARAQSIGWAFLHRPEAVFVGGQPSATDQPRYRIIASTPEGQLDLERRAGLIAEVTELVLDAEPAGRDRDPFRVWVFSAVIPESTWGSGGQLFGLADITTFVVGDPAVGHAHAQRRLS